MQVLTTAKQKTEFSDWRLHLHPLDVCDFNTLRIRSGFFPLDTYLSSSFPLVSSDAAFKADKFAKVRSAAIFFSYQKQYGPH